MKEYLKSISKKNYEVCYITGKSHYEDFIKEKYAPNVKVFSYMEDLPGLLKVSDLVVSRAGAGSLSEILALEIPSIIIPSPNVANNHQYFNAKELAQKNCICLLEEKDVTKEKILTVVDQMLTDTTKRLRMIHAMHSLDTKNSAEVIYQEIKELIS